MSSNQKGVLVAFRYGLEYKMLSPEVVDDEGRFVLHMEIQESPYVLINYYAPNIELNQVRKLQQIKSNLRNMSMNENTQFILTGDWNLIFDRSLDALGGSPTLKFNSLKEIQSLMIDYELLDIWRARNSTLRQFTWMQKNPAKLRRLDFFLVSDSLQCDIKACEFLSPLQSDHSPILLRITSIQEGQHRGRGYWKFNNSLTNDPVFVNSLKEEINNVASCFDKEQDPRVNWEYLQYKIFRFSTDYANEKAEQRKEKQLYLENKVINLEKKLSKSTNMSETLLTEHKRTQAELENLYDYIADGAILRSKARWYEEGEKNTKYFLSLETSNKSKSCIRKLIIDDSVEITDQAAVRKKIKTFYENLYTKKSMKTEQECFEYLTKISTPKLSENDKAICEYKLTLQNIWEALNSMKNGKTPGNDGLTKEFYVFWFFLKRWGHHF